MQFDPDRPNNRELKALSRLCLNTVEDPAAFVSVGKKTFEAMLAKGWIVEAHDDTYGTDGYQITPEGEQVWEANYTRLRR